MMYNRIDEIREEAIEVEMFEEEEPEEINDYMSIATMVIARHILECAKELEDIGFNLEDMDY